MSSKLQKLKQEAALGLSGFSFFGGEKNPDLHDTACKEALLAYLKKIVNGNFSTQTEV